MEYVPGIHAVPGVRGGNVYLLTEGPLTLVDCGLPGTERAVLRYIQRLGFAASELARILLTHRHVDHAGGAGVLRRATGARVYAHAGDVEMANGSATLRGRLVGYPLEVDCVLRGGEVLEPGIRVIHAGGHTAGSTAFLSAPLGALFVGDLAVNNVNRISRPLPFSNEDRVAYERGLAALAEVEADVGFFGHGPPLLAGMQQALAQLSLRPPSPRWRSLLRYFLARKRLWPGLD